MSDVTIFDWQGLPWKVAEAHETKLGFDVYRGYTNRRLSGKRLTWILTPELADYLRATREVHLQLPISGTPIYRLRKLLGLAVAREVGDRGFQWTQAYLALLGKASDVDVAKAIGTTMPVVRGKRAALQIAAYKHVFWNSEREALLGTAPDRELAQRLGTTFSAVAKRRDVLKIPAFGNWQRKAKRPARYRDPVSGATWSGFAVEPYWIKGRERALFVMTT
jgi:H-NS histone family